MSRAAAARLQQFPARRRFAAPITQAPQARCWINQARRPPPGRRPPRPPLHCARPCGAATPRGGSARGDSAVSPRMRPCGGWKGPGSAGRRTRPPARAATLRPAPPRRALHRARRGGLARVQHWRGLASGIAADPLANPIRRPGPRPIRPPAMKCHAAAPFWPDSTASRRTRPRIFALRRHFLAVQTAIAPTSMHTR